MLIIEDRIEELSKKYKGEELFAELLLQGILPVDIKLACNFKTGQYIDLYISYFNWYWSFGSNYRKTNSEIKQCKESLRNYLYLGIIILIVILFLITT